MNKQALMEQLYLEYKTQNKGEEIVLGEGNLNARLFLIGEAPGRDEVKQGRPFVGAAGKNLSDFLSLLEVQRQELYITNAIKYRLSKVNEKTNRVVNRPATKEEINRNRDTLIKEIEIIRPEFIITLGSVPYKAVTMEASVNMSNVHGTIMPLTISDLSYNLFPLYHPASIIYNRSLKDVCDGDIIKLKNIIKQKNVI